MSIFTPSVFNPVVFMLKIPIHQLTTEDRHVHCDWKLSASKQKGKTHKGADLAVFIGLGLKLDTKLPPVKGPRELWALHSEEAQFVNTPDPTAWDGLFNYSTVWIRETGLHGERWRLHYHKLSSPKTRNFAAERRAKFGPALANALWFVSNCIYDSFWAPSSGRVSYALELGKNIEVNAFSRKKAGSYFCTGPLASIQKTAKQNEQPAFDEYLFYLSFENSLCRDYITEKFWISIGIAKISIYSSAYSHVLFPEICKALIEYSSALSFHLETTFSRTALNMLKLVAIKQYTLEAATSRNYLVIQNTDWEHMYRAC